MTRTELWEEVDWLLNMGEHPTHIAHALGRTTATIERYAHQDGNRELAAIFREAGKRVVV